MTVVLLNCLEKIVMATNNSGLNSTYLLISENNVKEKEEKGGERDYQAKC